MNKKQVLEGSTPHEYQTALSNLSHGQMLLAWLRGFFDMRKLVGGGHSKTILKRLAATG